MLVLTRRVGERVQVGPDVCLTVVRIEDGSVRIGVEAPPSTLVLREELARKPRLAESAALAVQPMQPEAIRPGKPAPRGHLTKAIAAR